MPFPEILDSSILASFKSCPELFRKTYIENWKPKEPSVHLHAGAAFAKAIEVTRTEFYVNGKSPEDSIARGLQALLEAYGDFPCPPESPKSAERMCGAFEFYWSNYPLDAETAPIILPGGRHAIEFSFAEPLPILHPETGNPLLYCGRMDAILNYAGGPRICDEKTTTQLGASWSRQWDLRAQFTGYSWAVAKAGIRVEGVMVRGVSILKTKYDTQQAFIQVFDWQIERWYEELLQWITDMKQCYIHSTWRHNLDHACAEYGGCSFRTACLSQDETPWLETGFERRVWNPLLRTEEKV